MLFMFILPPVVAVLYFLYNYDRNEILGTVGSSCLVMLFVFTAGLLIASLGGVFVSQQLLDDADFTKTTEVRHLAAFGDRTGAVTNSSFFLGSGSIGSTAYYYYYEVLPNGGKRFGKTNAESRFVEIHETDRSDGELHLRHFDYKGSLGFWFMTGDRHEIVAQTFYVPKGTVLNSFKADLE